MIKASARVQSAVLFFFIFPALCFAGVDRQAQIKQYLHDFVGQAFPQSYPTIYKAIKSALEHLPQKALDKVSDADFPVLFIEMPHFGGGRWANSNGIYVEPNDPPTFTKGVWIIKLSTELEEVKDYEAVEGLVLHELAHFVLGHQAGGNFDLQKEKDANRLVKKWGCERQFLKAKKNFPTRSAKTR